MIVFINLVESRGDESPILVELPPKLPVAISGLLVQLLAD